MVNNRGQFLGILLVFLFRWDQYLTIPRVNRIAVYVSYSVQGDDEVGRMIRRTIMRYVCLSQTLLFRKLSEHVRRRFPMLTDLVTAGLLTDCELRIIEELEEKFPGFTKNWMPIVWAASIVSRARAEGRIKDDFSAVKIIEALNLFRSRSNILIHYYTINIPLVYTQVVCIAVYFHFLVKLFSTQQSSSQANEIQCFVFSVILLFQFIVYMGWLKVAETMINPFGNDDDDFEVNDIIDFSVQTGYFIVDEMHNEHPDLLKGEEQIFCKTFIGVKMFHVERINAKLMYSNGFLMQLGEFFFKKREEIKAVED